MGALFGLLNFNVILWAWSRIFIKKRIALALGVIVIKYAIVLLILYSFVIRYELDVLSLILGMTTMLTVTMAMALLVAQDKKETV